MAGFGDFSTRTNETDMLMRNTITGQFEIYDISNNQLTSAAPMGQVGLEWQVAGFGDFSGNANETDMLMRNIFTGQFEIYDISNNQITSAAPMGQVGLEWQVAGFGDFQRPGTSDMLMRDCSTGAFEVYDIGKNQLTGAARDGPSRAGMAGRRHCRRSEQSARAGNGGVWFGWRSCRYRRVVRRCGHAAKFDNSVRRARTASQLNINSEPGLAGQTREHLVESPNPDGRRGSKIRRRRNRSPAACSGSG